MSLIETCFCLWLYGIVYPFLGNLITNIAILSITQSQLEWVLDYPGLRVFSWEMIKQGGGTTKSFLHILRRLHKFDKIFYLRYICQDWERKMIHELMSCVLSASFRGGFLQHQKLIITYYFKKLNHCVSLVPRGTELFEYGFVRQRSFLSLKQTNLKEWKQTHSMFPENWHFNLRFVLKTIKTPVFVFITEILWRNFWNNRWRSIFDVV